MEGIVRQIWRALPNCDIGFVYTITEALVPPLLEGKFQRSASAMEKVAAHYGLPTIHLGLEVAKLAREGKLEWRAKLPKTDAEKQALGGKFVFAPDSVHPHPETGHELYLQAVARSLGPIEQASAKPGAHALAAPLKPDNYERAALMPIRASMVSAGFRRLDPKTDEFGKRWANRLTSLHEALKPGELLSFRFKGTRCAIYDVIGPDSGQVTVTLDDQPARVVPRFDAYCTYHRLGSFVVGTDLPDTVHTVRIEVHAESPDKAKILAQRQQTIDKPERFAGTAFHPGALLLVGEIVE
jgi:hypothetical protein